MAEQTQTRTVRIVIDSSQARQGGQEVVAALKGIEDRASAAMAGVTKAMATIAAAMAIVASVKAFAESIAKAGDEVRNLTAQLNYATGAISGSRAAFEAVVAIANKTGASLIEVGGAFQRIALGARDIGATADQVARVTETFIKLGRVGGASMSDINGALVQFGQSMASGRVQGDEFRSLMERVPAVMRTIAKELGVNIGQLREMATAGELTADRAFGALQKGARDADAAFASLPVTLEQAGNRATTAWKLFGAALDDSIGLGAFLARAMDSASERVTVLAKRISGDLNQAIADTGAKLAALQARADQVRAQREALTPKPDAQGVTPALPGGTFARGLPGSQPGVGTIPRDIAATQAQKAIELEEQAIARRIEDERKAGEVMDANVAKIRNQAAAVAKATTEWQKFQGSIDKAAGSQRKLEEAQKQVSEAVKAGVITQEQGDAALAKYRKTLDEVGGGSKRTADGVTEFIRSLEQQLDVVKQTDRESFILSQTYRLLEIAKRENIKLTDLEIEKTKGLAAAIYDQRQLEKEQATKQREMEAQAQRNAELMMEPYKNALRSMQQTTADFFANIFNGGTTSFKGLAQSMRQIWSQMLGQMISQWIFSQNQMQQSTVGGTGGAAPIGGGFGGGLGGGAGQLPFGQLVSGIQGILGLGGGSGAVGVANQWQPLAGGLAGNAAPQAGIGAIGGGGLFGNSAGLGGSQLGGLFSGAGGGGGGMMGFLGIGMGALSAATSRTTGGRVAGVGSAVGSALMMIPNPWTMAAGAIISIGSQIVGTLIDRGNKVRHQGTSNIEIDAGASPWNMAFVGNNTASGSISAARLERGNTVVSNEINRIMFGIGGKFTADALGGYILESQGQNTGHQFGYGLGNYNLGPYVDPNNNTGGRFGLPQDIPADNAQRARELGMGLSAEEATSRLISAIIRDAAQNDRIVSDGSRYLTPAILKVLQDSAEDLDAEKLRANIETARTFDELMETGRAADSTRDAIEDLRNQFRGLEFDAGRLGLDVAALTGVLNRSLSDLATDHNRSITDEILGINDPTALGMLNLGRWRTEQLDIVQAFLDEQVINAAQAQERIAKIYELYGLRQQQIVEQTTNGAMGNIESLMRRLIFGDLSLSTPAQTLSGLSATYAATTAQARAGDAGALQRYAGVAAEYAQFSNQYYGGDTRAAALRAQILADSANLLASNGDPVSQLTGRMDTVTRALVEMIEMLRAGTATSGQVIGRLDELIDELKTDDMAPSNSTVIDAAA